MEASKDKNLTSFENRQAAPLFLNDNITSDSQKTTTQTFTPPPQLLSPIPESVIDFLRSNLNEVSSNGPSYDDSLLRCICHSFVTFIELASSEIPIYCRNGEVSENSVKLCLKRLWNIDFDSPQSSKRTHYDKLVLESTTFGDLSTDSNLGIFQTESSNSLKSQINYTASILSPLNTVDLIRTGNLIKQNSNSNISIQQSYKDSEITSLSTQSNHSTDSQPTSIMPTYCDIIHSNTTLTQPNKAILSMFELANKSNINSKLISQNCSHPSDNTPHLIEDVFELGETQKRLLLYQHEEQEFETSKYATSDLLETTNIQDLDSYDILSEKDINFEKSEILNKFEGNNNYKDESFHLNISAINEAIDNSNVCEVEELFDHLDEFNIEKPDLLEHLQADTKKNCTNITQKELNNQGKLLDEEENEEDLSEFELLAALEE